MSVGRYQNPVVGNLLDLQILLYNSNVPANIYSIDKVETYFLDPTKCSDCLPDGRTLVETIIDITNNDTGIYSIQVDLQSDVYVIGSYKDVWYVRYTATDVTPITIENHFKVYPNLFISTTFPPVYQLSWGFGPNRFRKGSSKFFSVKVNANVPRATDLERYYTNLIISSELSFSLFEDCTPCGDNCEENVLLEDEPIVIRDKCYGFYQLDTTENGLDMDIGIYTIEFKIVYANTTDISDRYQLEIY